MNPEIRQGTPGSDTQDFITHSTLSSMIFGVFARISLPPSPTGEVQETQRDLAEVHWAWGIYPFYSKQ